MKTVIRIGRIITPIMVCLAIGASLIFWLISAQAKTLDTYHSSWKLIRETATEDGANFAAVYNLASDGGDFASKDSSTVANGGPYRIRSYFGGEGTEFVSSGGAMVFAICGGLSENDTFSFNIVGWGRTNGMLQVIAEGDGIIGTQDVVKYPDDGATATNIWWADTINLDETTKWPAVGVYNSGDNEMEIGRAHV